MSGLDNPGKSGYDLEVNQSTTTMLPSDQQPVITNERGGSQSDIGARFDLIPPLALTQVAEVLHRGAAKYGENNWRKIDTVDHVNHAIAHLYGWLAAYTVEQESEAVEELSHAATRLLFALELEALQDEEPYESALTENGLEGVWQEYVSS